MKNLINKKRTPKDDIGYGVKAAALSEMKLSNTDFDIINEGVSNNYSDFDENELLEDF